MEELEEESWCVIVLNFFGHAMWYRNFFLEHFFLFWRNLTRVWMLFGRKIVVGKTRKCFKIFGLFDLRCMTRIPSYG